MSPGIMHERFTSPGHVLDLYVAQLLAAIAYDKEHKLCFKLLTIEFGLNFLFLPKEFEGLEILYCYIIKINV
jgi:hypothetical protein